MFLATIMYIDNRDWSLYNQRLINRGRIVTIFLKESNLNWEDELRKSNANKRGKPYKYPNTIMLVGFGIKCVLCLGYRQLQGFMEDICGFLRFSMPNFRTFWWRINRMERQGVKFTVPPNKKKIDIAVDSTGLKLVNDGEYRTKKYKKMKSWAKFHAGVNENTGEGVNVIITKDNVGDCKEFAPLIDPISNIVGKVDADGAYDTNADFEYCKKHGLEAVIPVKSNASLKGLGARSDAVREQFGINRKPRWGRPPNWLHNLDARQKNAMQDKWRKKTEHGKRWVVEGFYSRYKRQFGEYVFSKKKINVEKEVVMKTNILNMFITM